MIHVDTIYFPINSLYNNYCYYVHKMNYISIRRWPVRPCGWCACRLFYLSAQVFTHCHLLLFTHCHLLLFTHCHLLLFTHCHLLLFTHCHLLLFTHCHLLPFTHCHLLLFTHWHLLLFTHCHLLLFTHCHLLLSWSTADGSSPVSSWTDILIALCASVAT